jgi:SAM-dependent methyltransferase
MILIVDGVDLENVPYLVPGMEGYKDAGTVEVLEVPETWTPPREMPSGLTVRRYFDRYFLVVPNDDPVRTQRVIDVLFATVARFYDSLIQRRRNEENIRLMLQHVLTLAPHGSDPHVRVLDIGCGTGLAQEVAVGMNIHLVGIDRSSDMRFLAAQRGMTVYDPAQFCASSEHHFQGAIASYVFHLSVDAALLSNVWKRLTVGSPVVANFHKGGGRDHAVQLFASLGAEIRLDEPRSATKDHGSYVTFRKSE